MVCIHLVDTWVASVALRKYLEQNQLPSNMFQPEGLENGSVINNYGQSSLKMHSSLQHPCSDHQKTSTSCWPAFMAVGCEFIKQQLWAGSHGCNSEKLALDWNRWMVPLQASIHFEEASETHDVVGCFWGHPSLWKVKREKEDLDINGCHYLTSWPLVVILYFSKE